MKTVESLHDLLVMTPKARSIEKPNLLDVIKIKNFCSPKATVENMKRQARDLEKIFTHHIPGKDHR